MAKRSLRIGAAVIGVFALCGCESYAKGPLSISREGLDILVATCVEVKADSVFAEVTNGGVPPTYTTIADIEGSEYLPIGGKINLASPPPTLLGEVNAVNLDGLLTVYVLVGSETNDIAAAFDIPSDGIPDDLWLQTSGQLTPSPC